MEQESNQEEISQEERIRRAKAMMAPKEYEERIAFLGLS